MTCAWSCLVLICRGKANARMLIFGFVIPPISLQGDCAIYSRKTTTSMHHKKQTGSISPQQIEASFRRRAEVRTCGGPSLGHPDPNHLDLGRAPDPNAHVGQGGPISFPQNEWFGLMLWRCSESGNPRRVGDSRIRTPENSTKADLVL